MAPGDAQSFHDHNTNMSYFVFKVSLVEETINGEKEYTMQMMRQFQQQMNAI